MLNRPETGFAMTRSLFNLKLLVLDQVTWSRRHFVFRSPSVSSIQIEAQIRSFSASYPAVTFHWALLTSNKSSLSSFMEHKSSSNSAIYPPIPLIFLSTVSRSSNLCLICLYLSCIAFYVTMQESFCILLALFTAMSKSSFVVLFGAICASTAGTLRTIARSSLAVKFGLRPIRAFAVASLVASSLWFLGILQWESSKRGELKEEGFRSFYCDVVTLKRSWRLLIAKKAVLRI